ncbi:MAG: hypothetical protein Ta2A_22220 [Treponemataceae bacterium]|nr:MAG: hypothetical protein Ta2A_22220 [Treponemataceae bacterium]
MKKIAVLVLVAALALPMAVFAQGYGGCRGGQSGNYELCPYTNCAISGNHYHNDVCYSGRYNNDGQTCHR